MKRVHPSVVGATDLGTLVHEQDEAAQRAADEPQGPKVWIWTLATVDQNKSRDADYMGVHTTSAGAWLALKAEAIDASGGTLSIPDDADLATINAALDDAEWVHKYSVSCRPLVTP